MPRNMCSSFLPCVSRLWWVSRRVLRVNNTVRFCIVVFEGNTGVIWYRARVLYWVCWGGGRIERGKHVAIQGMEGRMIEGWWRQQKGEELMNGKWQRGREGAHQSGMSHKQRKRTNEIHYLIFNEEKSENSLTLLLKLLLFLAPRDKILKKVA